MSMGTLKIFCWQIKKILLASGVESFLHNVPMDKLSCWRQGQWICSQITICVCVCVVSLSRVWLFATWWTVAHLAPLSLGSSRQEYWSGLPFPSPMRACMLIHFSRVRLCVTLWTAAHQAPLSTGFSRQEYWSGLPFPSLIVRAQ